MASWTLQNFGGYPKCLKWSSQSRPVAKRVPMRLQKVSWSEKWATSQLECKSSLKMLILLCVFEGPSQIHWYLQAKLLPHSVDVAGYTSRPLYQHRKNPYSWRLFGEYWKLNQLSVDVVGRIPKWIHVQCFWNHHAWEQAISKDGTVSLKASCLRQSNPER